MPDWKRLAAARGLDITDEEIERIQGPLDALEASWRPLTTRIPYDAEPAIVMHCRPLPAAEDSE